MPDWFSANAPAPTRRDDWFSANTPTPEQPQYSFLDRLVTGAARVVPALAGGFGAGALAIESGPGAIAAGAAGGAGGAALGEWLAQKYEQMRGLRKDTNLGDIAVEAGLGAIPLGKSASWGRAALKGAGLSTAGTIGHSYAERGEAPSAGELALSAGLGGALGGGAELLGDRLFGKAPERVPEPDLAGFDTEAGRAAADDAFRRRFGDFDQSEGGFDPTDIATRHAAEPRLSDDLVPAVEGVAREPQPVSAWWTENAPREPQAIEPPAPFSPILAQRPQGPRMEPAPETGFPDYVQRDQGVRARLDAERAAEADALLAPEQARAAFDAPIPDRLLPPPPDRQRWEDVNPRAATPADSALRGLIPPRVLKGEGTIGELAETAGQEAAARPSPLQQLFGRAQDESGRIGAELAPTLGGAALGGVVGGTQGETPEEHIRNAVLGAGAGAAGGATLARFLRPKAPQLTEAAERILAPGTPVRETVPRGGEVIPPIGSIKTATGRRFSTEEGDHPVFEFAAPHDPIERRQAMPKAQRENLGLHNLPSDMRKPVGELLDEFGPNVEELERQRGGRQSIARTEALAQRIKIDAESALKPGTILPRAEQLAYANGYVDIARQLKANARKIQETGGTDLDHARQLMLGNAFSAMYASSRGMASETAGALNIQRHIKGMMPGDLRLVSEMMDRGRLRKDMADLADIYANLPDDPSAAYEVLKGHEVQSLSQTVGSYYTSNILSGWKTQMRNALGNGTRLVGRIATKPAAAGADAFRSMLTGAPREVFAGETGQEVRGLVAGFDTALKDAWATFSKGYSPTALNEGLEDVTKLYAPRAEFAGGLKNPLNVPHRLLGSVDRFFRQLNGSMELYSRTYATAQKEAVEKGIGSGALDEFVSSRMADLRANPSMELRRQVAAAGERGVFQEPQGAAVGLIQGLKHQVPALQYVMPFVSTVSNIFKQGAEHSPMGFFMKRARSADLRERATAQGEAAFGTAALLPLAYLAATGRVSGSGPSDRAERASLMESGWRPNAINLPLPDAVAHALGASKSDDGSYWVNYTLLQPLSVPLGIVANGFDAWHDAQRAGNKKGAADIAAETIARAGKSAVQQSFLSGVSDLVEALNDPEAAAAQFAGHLGQGFVPMSGLLRNVAQTIDPTVRQPKGIGESIEANIPGLSQRVAPRLTRFGEDVTRAGNSGFAVPEVEPNNRDRIADELHRLNVNIGAPSDTLQLPPNVTQKLTPDQGLALRRLRGQKTRAMLAAVLGAPGYEQLPDAARAHILRQAMQESSSDINDAARVSLILQQPELMRLLGAPIAEAAAATY
jgi:hypothetical protein